jgi:hypothetical protein
LIWAPSWETRVTMAMRHSRSRKKQTSWKLQRRHRMGRPLLLLRIRRS